MVSRLMENGNMLEYLNQYQGHIDRLDLVSTDSDHVDECVYPDGDHPQLLGIIRGLNYLNRHRVVHGDLKGVRTISSPHNTT